MSARLVFFPLHLLFKNLIAVINAMHSYISSYTHIMLCTKLDLINTSSASVQYLWEKFFSSLSHSKQPANSDTTICTKNDGKKTETAKKI